MSDGGSCESRPRSGRGGPGPLRRLLLAAGSLACALAFAGASAQATSDEKVEDFSATWWNVMNGLPQSSILAFVLTESGEMWIATQGGLAVFDGSEFRRLDVGTLTGLRSNHITALVDDAAGGLWFSTKAGNLHHLRDERIDETIEVGGPDSVVALLRARDGSLWTQGLDGAVWRFAHGEPRQILPPAGTGRPRGLFLRGDGVVCAAAHDQVVLLRETGDEFARLQAPAPVFSLAADGAQELWVGTAEGLCRSHEGALRPFVVAPEIDGAVHAIADDSRGSLWVATPRGITLVSTDSAETRVIRVRFSVEIPRTLEVRSILLDGERNVWLGAFDSGLFRLRPCRLSFFRPYSASRVSALCEDGAGGAWVGCGDRGLARIFPDGTEGIVRQFDVPGADPPVVQALLHDRRGRTWVGVNSSWMRKGPADTEDFEPVLADLDSYPAAGPIAETAGGDVWLGALDGHVVRVDADDQVVETVDLPGPIYVLVADGDALWAGGSEHVFRVRNGVIEQFGASEGVPPGTVRDLALDPRGGVWIATYGGGLAHLVDGRARALTTLHGLIDSSLSRLQFDAARTPVDRVQQGTHGDLARRTRRRARRPQAADRAGRDRARDGHERGRARLSSRLPRHAGSHLDRHDRRPRAPRCGRVPVQPCRAARAHPRRARRGHAARAGLSDRDPDRHASPAVRVHGQCADGRTAHAVPLPPRRATTRIGASPGRRGRPRTPRCRRARTRSA